MSLLTAQMRLHRPSGRARDTIVARRAIRQVRAKTTVVGKARSAPPVRGSRKVLPDAQFPETIQLRGGNVFQAAGGVLPVPPFFRFGAPILHFLLCQLRALEAHLFQRTEIAPSLFHGS